MASLSLNLAHSFRNFSLRATADSSNGAAFPTSKSGGPVILEIPLDKIRRPLMRTRANDPKKVDELMDSIREIGLQEPHENDCGGSIKSSSTGKTKVQIGTLEHFLEETFQLQRYMVATGQKLMELQSRIACIFVDNSERREPRGFDVRQFADGIRTLFREIQRGLEVRIARIIGDLEGTLACEGSLNLRN